MNKIIIFQKCNWNNIYFLLYIIMFFINLFIESFNYSIDLEVEDSEKYKYNLSQTILNLYLLNLSDFIAIIPYFIRKKLLRKKEKPEVTISKIDENNNSETLSLIYTDNKLIESNKRKKKVIYYSILIAILDFLFEFSLILYNIIYPTQITATFTFSCTIPFEICFQFICSYFILKTHFYKLQYFSLFLNLVIFIILLILDIILSFEHELVDGKFYIFILASIIFYSIEYSYGKKLLLYGFISVYLLLLLRGVFKLVIVVFLSIFLVIFKRDVFSGIKYFITGPKYALLVVSNIVGKFFLSLFLWLIIDRFSPNYFPLALIFHETFFFILDEIFEPGGNDWDIYLRIALYVISFIGVILHNEIVVINICNLGSDTKYFLDEKFKHEELYINSDDPDILKRYETLLEMEAKSERNSTLSQ